MIKRWLKRKFGITKLEEDLVAAKTELERRIHSYKESNRCFQNRLDKLDSLVRECTSVSADIHLKGRQETVVFIAGRYRNRDYAKLFTLDTEELPQMIDQLKFLERRHSRSFYDVPYSDGYGIFYGEGRMTIEAGLTEADANFYGGILVALQTIVAYGADTLAEEIVNGLGSSVKGLEIHANNEGGVDLETINYLKDRGIIR